MSGITLAVNLAISIAIILFLVLKFKINPVISMILASLYMGISCSLGFMDTITSINSGFGSLMTGIGFPIGFGIMMGQILEDSGAAESLAKSILKAFPGKKAPWALGLTAFLLSIPVFFDVTFVILIPLGIAVAKETKRPLAYFAGAAAAGEHEEWSLDYPHFADVAEQEGFPMIAAMYRNISIAEKGHEERYLAFVNNIENMTVFAKEGEVVWQCRNCGYIEIGKEAPEVCPACLHPQAYFEVKKENY